MASTSPIAICSKLSLWSLQHWCSSCDQPQKRRYVEQKVSLWHFPCLSHPPFSCRGAGDCGQSPFTHWYCRSMFSTVFSSRHVFILGGCSSAGTFYEKTAFLICTLYSLFEVCVSFIFVSAWQMIWIPLNRCRGTKLVSISSLTWQQSPKRTLYCCEFFSRPAVRSDVNKVGIEQSTSRNLQGQSSLHTRTRRCLDLIKSGASSSSNFSKLKNLKQQFSVPLPHIDRGSSWRGLPASAHRQRIMLAGTPRFRAW